MKKHSKRAPRPDRFTWSGDDVLFLRIDGAALESSPLTKREEQASPTTSPSPRDAPTTE